MDPYEKQAIKIRDGNRSVESILRDESLGIHAMLAGLFLRGDACDPAVVDEYRKVVGRTYRDNFMAGPDHTETVHRWRGRTQSNKPRLAVHKVPVLVLAARECPDLTGARRMIHHGTTYPSWSLSSYHVAYPEEWDKHAIERATIDGQMTWIADQAIRYLRAPPGPTAEREWDTLQLFVSMVVEDGKPSNRFREDQTVPRLLEECRRDPSLRPACTSERGERTIAYLLTSALGTFPPPPDNVSGDVTPLGYGVDWTDRPGVLLNQFLAVAVRLGHRPYVELALMLGANPRESVKATDLGLVTTDGKHGASTVPYEVHALSFAELAHWQGSRTPAPVYDELHALFVGMGALDRSDEALASLAAELAVARKAKRNDFLEGMEESRKHMNKIFEQAQAEHDAKYGHIARENACVARGVERSVCAVNPDAEPRDLIGEVLQDGARWGQMYQDLNQTRDLALPSRIITLTGGGDTATSTTTSSVGSTSTEVPEYPCPPIYDRIHLPGEGWVPNPGLAELKQKFPGCPVTARTSDGPSDNGQPVNQE